MKIIELFNKDDNVESTVLLLDGNTATKMYKKMLCGERFENAVFSVSEIITHHYNYVFLIEHLDVFGNELDKPQIYINKPSYLFQLLNECDSFREVYNYEDYTV